MTECYECSRLAELVAQNTAMRAKLGADAPEKPVGALGRLADAMNEPISRFNAQEPGENAENGATKSEMRDFDDSREKLEEIAWEYDASYAGPYDHGAIAEAIIELLDRQAAITANEANNVHGLGCEACRAAQKRRIAELCEENEALREWKACYKRMAAERDELRRRMRDMGIDLDGEVER